MSVPDAVPTGDALRARETASRQLMLTGVGSLLSLWNAAAGGMIRDTEDLAEPLAFRPTATFHGIVALAECGVWHADTTYDARRSRLRTVHGDVPTTVVPPAAADILRRIVLLPGGGAESPASWVSDVISRSSHSRETQKKPSSRFTIPLERLTSATAALIQVIGDGELTALRDPLIAGFHEAEDRLSALLLRGSAPLGAAELYESADFAPGILLNVVTCLQSLDACYRRLSAEQARRLSADTIAAMLKHLRDATLRHVDYHMARHAVALDPTYDPVSLTFALRALCATSPEERSFAFFRACIDAIVARQQQDGCWPDGVSITFEPTADVVQQPSAGVALHLAECAIHDHALTEHLEEERSLLDAVLPALRKTMQYLRVTHTEIEAGGRRYRGWSSDRIRRPNYVETWITAYSTRLLRRLWIGENAALRSYALTRLGVSQHRGDYRLHSASGDAWRESIVDPDALTRPAGVVWERVVEPILRQRSAGNVFQRPRPSAVSFIIFGPPGSGKTFFVQKLADFLGWPLVTVTPGHFIQRGLELIEAVARDIFDHLHLLNHAVVFFDECDELFRSRDHESPGSARSILSFATASMLPKLQELHDAANVVFVLGTNYLRNIDTAVRRPGRFDDILLFDRPDDEARERHIRRVLTGTSARERKQVAQLVSGTRGLTVKEVIRAANAVASGRDVPTATSIDDYREWYRRDGRAELKASRYDSELRARIHARWLRVESERKRRDSARTVRTKSSSGAR